MLDLFNSFDGSWAWFSAFGAINSICMNGLVSAQFAMVVTRKHTSGFSLNAEIARLARVIIGLCPVISPISSVIISKILFRIIAYTFVI